MGHNEMSMPGDMVLMWIFGLLVLVVLVLAALALVKYLRT